MKDYLMGRINWPLTQWTKDIELDKFFDHFESIEFKDAHWSETDTGKLLELHIPGYSKEEVSVKVEDNVCKIVWGDSEEGEYSFTLPIDCKVPDECIVKDGILTMNFKYKDKVVKNIIVK